MLRRILVVILAVGMSACSMLHAEFAARGPKPVSAPPPPAPAPQPEDGLWAILDPGCATPVAVDVHAWPACASPLWISGDRATVIVAGGAGKRALRDVSYAAAFSLSPGDPVIAQVGTEKDGYLFLALTDLARDGRGRLVAARGAAIACPNERQGSTIALKPALGGCDLDSVETVRAAAVATLHDQSALQTVAWIAPGNP